MYYITNLISNKCNVVNNKIHAYEDQSCKITNLAIAVIATLGIGGVTFCAIFFTTSLLIPSIAASISVVVLISGVDIALVICLKKKKDESERSSSDEKIEEKKIEEPIDPNIALKTRLQKFRDEDGTIHAGVVETYTEEQLTWLRTQFEQLESPDSTNSPLQNYLHAASRFPTAPLAAQTFGNFYFFCGVNFVAANVPLETLRAQSIQLEDFVSILTAFIRTSEKSFPLSARYNQYYRLEGLEISHVPKIKSEEKLQIQFKLKSF